KLFMLSHLHPKILYRSVNELKSRKSNPRTHRKKQIKQVADSIRQFGFVVPIILDAAACILAGHCRLSAAKLLGMTEVPTVQLDHMTEPEKRAYALADNRLAELAGWDDSLLVDELHYLTNL